MPIQPSDENSDLTDTLPGYEDLLEVFDKTVYLRVDNEYFAEEERDYYLNVAAGFVKSFMALTASIVSYRWVSSRVSPVELDIFDLSHSISSMVVYLLWFAIPLFALLLCGSFAMSALRNFMFRAPGTSELIELPKACTKTDNPELNVRIENTFSKLKSALELNQFSSEDQVNIQQIVGYIALTTAEEVLDDSDICSIQALLDKIDVHLSLVEDTIAVEQAKSDFLKDAMLGIPTQEDLARVKRLDKISSAADKFTR